MQLKELLLPDYRGLRDFHLDLTDAVDESGHAIAVLIGRNGSGKSRALQALAEIFGALYRRSATNDGRTAFAYCIRYVLQGTVVEVQQASPNSVPVMTAGPAGKALSRIPVKDWGRYLPDHVFGYQVHARTPWISEFTKHRIFAQKAVTHWRRKWIAEWNHWLDVREPGEHFQEQLTLPISCPLYTPGFLCTPNHLPLIILSLASQWSESFGSYLRKEAHVDSVASVILRIRPARSSTRADWAQFPYWGVGGPARTLFAALAESGRFGAIPEADPEVLLLGDRDDAENEVAGSPDDGFAITMNTAGDVLAFRNIFDSDLSMFGLLATLYDAGYLTADIRLRNTAGAILRADDLSSGEQQMLTVLGLLRLQRGQESLFLLDEPDAHFHPEWSQYWYTSVQSMLDDGQESQFVAATHDPMLVANIAREQIRVVQEVQAGTAALMPGTDPRGHGAGGLLTTELFGLRSQLDLHTQFLIDRQYDLVPQAELDEEKASELRAVTDELDSLGFATERRDPDVSAFLAELRRRRREIVAMAGGSALTPEQLGALVAQLFDERFSAGL